MLSRGEDVVPIPGTKRLSYLKENFEAADLVLTPDEIDAITKVSDNAKIVGERYPPAVLQGTYSKDGAT